TGPISKHAVAENFLTDGGADSTPRPARRINRDSDPTTRYVPPRKASQPDAIDDAAATLIRRSVPDDGAPQPTLPSTHAGAEPDLDFEAPTPLPLSANVQRPPPVVAPRAHAPALARAPAPISVRAPAPVPAPASAPASARAPASVPAP